MTFQLIDQTKPKKKKQSTAASFHLLGALDVSSHWGPCVPDRFSSRRVLDATAAMLQVAGTHERSTNKTADSFPVAADVSVREGANSC